MKKYIFIALISLCLFSCDDDVYGIGEDPKLNISEYTFSNKGDSIAIYSEKGYTGLSVVVSSTFGKLYYTGNESYCRGYYGDWWYAACPDERPHGSRVDIVVQPNDTGEERVLPIIISYYDWGGGVGKFVQEK